MAVTISRLLIYVHRWLGITLGALFVCWFASGLVMVYARMPRLTPAERQAKLARLDFSTARVDPSTATLNLPDLPDGLRLAMVGGRPVYRFQVNARPFSVYADSGEPLGPLTAEAALSEAKRFSPEHAATARYERYLSTPDQWTLEIARQLPLHRIALGDGDDARLYVSERTGEVVLKTTARERAWAYPGAILHWLYFTPFRRHGSVWAEVIIWTSLLGTLMCVAGLAWGLWSVSPRRWFRAQGIASATPYRGWMRWHHYAGLVAGVTAVTWTFSGLLSMDPWDWHPSTAPTEEQRRAFAGAAFTTDGLTANQLRSALAVLGAVQEAEVSLFRGDRYLASRDRLAALDGKAAVVVTLDRGALLAAAAAAGQGQAVDEVIWLDGYDAYYYDRDGELPLPVLRVRYHDPQRTWLYVNLTRGSVVRKEERLTRINRWLYHGLHSLDFPFLYYRRPLWDVFVLGLCLGGLVLSVTTIVPAFRRLRNLVRRS